MWSYVYATFLRWEFNINLEKLATATLAVHVISHTKIYKIGLDSQSQKEVC